MNSHDHMPLELFELFVLSFDGKLSEQQRESLNRQLLESSHARKCYLDFLVTYVGLNYSEGIVSLQEDESIDFDNDVLRELAEYEKTAPLLQFPQEQPQRELIQKVVYPARGKRKLSKFAVVSIILNAAAIVMFVLFSRFVPSRQYGIEVATLADCLHAEWVDAEETMQKGTRLCTGRNSLFLKKGLAELIFDNETRVTIEGPAGFQILTEDRIRLNYGKVYTTVSKEATGFSVYTQSAKIIDLGTEFGVRVNSRGETDIQLYKGKASIVPVSSQQTLSSQILQKGQARRVNLKGDVDDVSFKQHEFVRGFNSESTVLWSGQDINLAYVASGSNGFEPGAQDIGIDQVTGGLVSGNKEQRVNPESEGFVPVPQLPYVDGVFVPDGGQGPVQLTSEGHVFDGFGDTGGGYFMPIGSYSNINMMHDGKMNAEDTNIHLTDYPEETAVNLCLHANSGITFDLQKIRESMPFVKITGFSSVYGVPVTREDQGDVHVDFYVFVDGVARMIEKNVYNQDEPKQVSIPLTETDRFLTLACTEGSVNFGDWSVFVNPVLELELAD